MLFRSPTLFLLSALGGGTMAGAASREATTPRHLQAGIYEIAEPVVNYNPVDGNPNTGGTDSNSEPITIPSILVAFEHDDVTGIAAGIDAYGTIEISHYTAGCTTLIDRSPSTDLGEKIMPPIELSATNAVEEDTGLNDPYVATLKNGADTENGVLTIVRYPIAILVDEASGITTSVSGNDRTVKWCTRIDLVSDGKSQGFRKVDITLKYNVDNEAVIEVETAEENSGGVADPTVGDFTVKMFFADPPTVPATGALTEITDPFTTAAPLTQGESFTIGLAPQSTLSASVANTVDMDIVAVDSCIFWIDGPGGNDSPDLTEIQAEVIADNIENENVLFFRCDEGIIGTDSDGIHGCGFTVSLPIEFFTAPATVNGRCVVALEFQGTSGTRTRRRMQTDLVIGEQYPISTRTELAIAAAADDDSCMAGCFILFCWIRWIICFFQELFD